mmetsp:Transcript_24586/g.77260  ORF Transcript_24586/g.77260 Transcript_24586/m.77260 type:complete len:389 (+) Transcript_24586:555-1721(+)
MKRMSRRADHCHALLRAGRPQAAVGRSPPSGLNASGRQGPRARLGLQGPPLLRGRRDRLVQQPVLVGSSPGKPRPHSLAPSCAAGHGSPLGRHCRAARPGSLPGSPAAPEGLEPGGCCSCTARLGRPPGHQAAPAGLEPGGRSAPAPGRLLLPPHLGGELLGRQGPVPATAAPRPRSAPGAAHGRGGRLPAPRLHTTTRRSFRSHCRHQGSSCCSPALRLTACTPPAALSTAPAQLALPARGGQTGARFGPRRAPDGARRGPLHVLHGGRTNVLHGRRRQPGHAGLRRPFQHRRPARSRPAPGTAPTLRGPRRPTVPVLGEHLDDALQDRQEPLAAAGAAAGCRSRGRSSHAEHHGRPSSRRSSGARPRPAWQRHAGARRPHAARAQG